MSRVKLGWASAEVRDATLTVALEGEVPKDWKRSFERTVKLLGQGEWGEVKLKESAVKVNGVAPGSEDKLRHYLESIVAQANAADERRELEAKEAEERDGADRDGGEDDGPDAEMTAEFRTFAEEDREDDA